MNRPMIGIPSVSLGSIEGPAVRATEREDDVIKLTMTEGNPGGVSTKTDSADSPLRNLCFPSGKYVGREEVHEEGNISGCSGCTMGHRRSCISFRLEKACKSAALRRHPL